MAARLASRPGVRVVALKFRVKGMSLPEQRSSINLGCPTNAKAVETLRLGRKDDWILSSSVAEMGQSHDHTGTEKQELCPHNWFASSMLREEKKKKTRKRSYVTASRYGNRSAPLAVLLRHIFSAFRYTIHAPLMCGSIMCVSTRQINVLRCC